jgi:hypothetical protein
MYIFIFKKKRLTMKPLFNANKFNDIIELNKNCKIDFESEELKKINEKCNFS